MHISHRFKKQLYFRNVVSINGADSYQGLKAELDLAAGVGSSTSTDPEDFAGVLGTITNRSGTALTATANYLAGVEAVYDISGAKSTTYPVGACLGIIGDGTTSAHGAFVAVLDGDTSDATAAGAAFKVMNNVTAKSVKNFGFDWALDCQDASHDSSVAVNSAFYKKGIIRLTDDVCLLVGTATPTDGVSGTGAGDAGPGSIHLNTSDGKLRTNTNTKASPTWTIVGTQTA